MRRLATATTTIAAFLLLGSAARADITVCNDIGAAIHVAFGYQAQGNFRAAGWWIVEPNACQAAGFPFEGSTLYYAANSDEYKNGRATSREHWGNEIKLFVTTKDFDFDNADRTRLGATSEMFSTYEIPQWHLEKPTTFTVHFIHGSTTITATSQ